MSDPTVENAASDSTELYDVSLERVTCWLMTIPRSLADALGGPGATCLLDIGGRKGHGVVGATSDVLWCQFERRGGAWAGAVTLTKVSKR